MDRYLVRLVAVLVAVGTVFVACDGGGEEYGQGLPKPDATTPGDGTRLGETVPTTEAPTSTAAPTTNTTRAAPTTAAPTTRPPTTKPRVQALEISINGDGSGKPQFEPSTGTTCTGGVVRFTNRDGEPRAVESAKAGAFSSGPIAPGDSWEFTVKLPTGRYNYTDDTRPYAQGILEVGSCPR